MPYGLVLRFRKAWTTRSIHRGPLRRVTVVLSSDYTSLKPIHNQARYRQWTYSDYLPLLVQLLRCSAGYFAVCDMCAPTRSL